MNEYTTSNNKKSTNLYVITQLILNIYINMFIITSFPNIKFDKNLAILFLFCTTYVTLN